MKDWAETNKHAGYICIFLIGWLFNRNSLNFDLSYIFLNTLKTLNDMEVIMSEVNGIEIKYA